jgi:Rrf2 family protein
MRRREVFETMKITSLEEYGLRCLLRVGRQPDGEPIPAQEIAEREGLSLPYTQKIVRILVTAGLLESYRGAQGGYTLARSADEISMGDAIRALGGMLELDTICERHTGEQKVCSNAACCSIRPVWSYLSEFVVRTFDAIPLSMLLQDEEEVAQCLLQMAPPKLELEGSKFATA